MAPASGLRETIRMSLKKKQSKKQQPPEQRTPSPGRVGGPSDHPTLALTPSTLFGPVSPGSASMVAKGPSYHFQEVEKNCHFRLLPWTIVSVPVLEGLLKNLKYPVIICSDKFVEVVSILQQKKNKQFHELSDPNWHQHWTRSLPDDQWQDDDPFQIELWWPTLFMAWKSISVRVSNHEAAMRRGPDNMLQIAFQDRISAHHIIHVEKDLYLPGIPGKATADFFSTMDLPQDWHTYLRFLENSQIFFPLVIEGKIVTFACEYEYGQQETAAACQLSLYLCSGQHQRQALGFQGDLYGATIVDKTLTIYVSRWEEDNTIGVYPTPYTFSLATFPEFLKCYIFLCNIADQAAADATEVFNKWETRRGKKDLREIARIASLNPWLLNIPDDCEVFEEDTEDASMEDEDGSIFAHQGKS